MSTMRPVALIKLELDSAMRAQEAYAGHEPVHALAAEMRERNEAEIRELRRELTEATSGDLEISLDGAPVEGHHVRLSYFNRVTGSVQAAYRAASRGLASDGHLRRTDAVLSIASTSPGSFRVALKVQPVQLDLLEDPPSDRAMNSVIDRFQAIVDDRSGASVKEWAARASEPEVRSMIRVASTVATSRGKTRFRWIGTDKAERLVEVSAEAARDLARALAGQIDQEFLEVEGHLQMGQDSPPRVRITTIDDVHLASVTSDELLEQVKSLIFEDVRATLLVEMKTSSSGSPKTTTELVDIEAASPTGSHAGRDLTPSEPG